VNEFIEECRREWKRLRVPDLVANEMAADLAADLEEAEAEGASPDEVLGSAASDPRSFATSWAAERAVIPPPPLASRLRRRSLIHPVSAALTIVAAIGAALVIFASPNATAPIAVMRMPRLQPYPTKVSFARHAVWVAKVNGGDVLTFPQAHASGVAIHRVGSILLIVGIAGVILSMPLLFWSWRRFDTAPS
jgi:lysylphosphatidylglycerol synthetase-like protein (DUF2156 family)